MQLENRFWPTVVRFFAGHKQNAIFEDDTEKYLCIFSRKKFEYLNVCLKAINFSNECGYFSNFLRERSRWKIWLCRKSVAKKLHSLKKRLKTCLILKKFSWEKHHWDAGIIGTCFNFPNLRRTDSSSNQFFLWKLFNAKRWVRDRKKIRPTHSGVPSYLVWQWWDSAQLLIEFEIKILYILERWPVFLVHHWGFSTLATPTSLHLR